MKKLLFSCLITLSVSAILTGCSSSVRSSGSNAAKQDVTTWYKSQVWLNGLRIRPHESINQQEFSKQYLTNKIWWDKAFDFLKTHDLQNLKPGSYVIDSGNVIATVSELNPKEKDQVNWEAHRNFNDLQYVIKGKAEMGIAPLSDPKAKVIVPYSSKADTETFSVDGGKYYDAKPGTFFIFSPKEIHRPAFKVTGYDMIKKIVIKVRVP